MLSPSAPATCVVFDPNDRTIAERLVSDLRYAGVPTLLIRASDESPIRDSLANVVGWEAAVVVVSRHSAATGWLRRELDAYTLDVRALAARVVWAVVDDTPVSTAPVVKLGGYDAAFSQLLGELGCGDSGRPHSSQFLGSNGYGL